MGPIVDQIRTEFYAKAWNMGTILPFQQIALIELLRPQSVWTVLTLVFTFLGAKVIYNSYFHKLSSVPGPFLARITNWWSYYYELQQILPYKCKELSERYHSSTVRVGPNKVVVHDVAQYDMIYRSGSKFGKDPDFYHLFPSASGGGTAVTATDRQVHAERRKQLAAKLSRQNISAIQDLVGEKLSKVMDIYGKAADNKQTINIFAAWRSFTLDVISSFAFGHCMDGLSRPNFDHEMLDAMNVAVGSFYQFLRIPLVARLTTAKFLNPYLARVSKAMAAMAAFKKWARECVDAYVPNTNVRYLFDALFNPPSDTRKLSKDEIQTEAEDILIAGSDTTATTLTFALLHLAQHPDLWERLYEEILPAVPDLTSMPSWASLEALPFLTSCIKESLRVASPLPSYLWRVVPSEGLRLANGIQLHHNTVVGMSSLIVHYDAGVFPDPEKFNPSRWLGDDASELSRYLVPFSKGSRQCAGINMAYMELYVALAVTCRRFTIKLPSSPQKPLRVFEAFVGILKDDNWPMIFERRSG